MDGPTDRPKSARQREHVDMMNHCREGTSPRVNHSDTALEQMGSAAGGQRPQGQKR